MIVVLALVGCASKQSGGLATVPSDAANTCPSVQEHEALGLPDTETYAMLIGWAELPEIEDPIELFTDFLPKAIGRYEVQLNDEPVSKWAAACVYTHYLSLMPLVATPPAELPADLVDVFNAVVAENIQPLADELKAKALYRAELAIESDADWTPRAVQLAETLRL